MTEPFWDVACGDALDVLAAWRGDLFEAAICDPPAGINFMGVAFDADLGGEEQWVAYFTERFRAIREVCIPGAYGAFWAIPRTADWTMRALRRAGWHVVDTIVHLHAEGWAKAKSQLRSCHEVWVLVRDPRGPARPLHVDACRVPRTYAERPASWFRSGHSAKPNAEKITGAPAGNGIHVHEGGGWPTNVLLSHAGACSPGEACLAACGCGMAAPAPQAPGLSPNPCPGCGGERWWVCPVAELDEHAGHRKSGARAAGSRKGLGYGGADGDGGPAILPSEGGASRYYPVFYYDAKASPTERQAGCGHLHWVRDPTRPIGWRLALTYAEYEATPEWIETPGGRRRPGRAVGNVHPTIKPVGLLDGDGLMRWWVRLLTPDGGAVVDGMAGSGGTLLGARAERRSAFGVDIDPGAVCISRARLAHWTPDRIVTARPRGARPATPLPPAALAQGRSAQLGLDLLGEGR